MRAFIESILSSLSDIFDPAVLGTQVVEWFGKLIVGSLVFTVFYLLWLTLRRIVRPLLNTTKGTKPHKDFYLQS